MYLDNKYTKWYNSIIENSNNRTIDGYTEKHHIIPRSLGGNDDSSNLAILTAREHFICHLLLTKMTTGNARYKMCFALHMITNARNIGEGRYTPTSRLYEHTKHLFREAVNAMWTEEKRKKHGVITGAKSKGRKWSDSSKENLKNKKWTQKALENRLQNCLKAAESRKGSKWSDEQHDKRFNAYVEKNKHLFPQVLELYDSGLNIRKVSLTLGVSWDRTKYIIDNRERLNIA
jgi:hypothetical protein